jgi:RHS repeat-associated protein
VTDASSKRRATCFYYDTSNRLRGKSYPTGISDPLTFTCPADPGESGYAVVYRYDEGTNALGQAQKGFRTSMNDPSGSTTWQYDMLGRVLKESKTITGAPANPYVTEYTYNTLGQVLTLKYPAGGQTVETVTTTYNAQNLPQSLSGTNGYITSASYNASDQITNLAFQSGTTTTYGYDPKMLRLTSLVTSGNIQNFGYTYDNVGNVKTITDYVPNPDQVTTFNYDDLNRLKDATLPGVYAHSWTYNPIGNMLTRNDNNGNVTYSYNDTAHKHAVTQAGANYFCYDQNGNMTRRNATTSACTNGDALTYDKENRLTSITVGSTTTTFVYDGDGNRVKKVVGSTATYYVGNYYEVTNNVATKYVYFGKQRVALKKNGAVTYLHGDHLGSTSVTTNASGQCTSAQWYYAYGNIRTPAPTLPCSGTPATDYGFTGQRRDAGASLLYYGARYYDSALGRFIQADTIVPQAGNPQTLNRYSYTLNNPVRYNDPDGHCVPLCLVPVGGAVIASGWDLAVQVIFENRSFTPTEGQKGIDGGRTIGAAAGGAVFATTMVAATPLIGGGVMGAAATLAIGGVGGILAGRADVFSHATADEIWRVVTGQNFDFQRWNADMQGYGFDDPTSIGADAFAGAMGAGTGRLLSETAVKAGLINSAERSGILRNLPTSLSSPQWDIPNKSWYFQTTTRRIYLTQAQWQQVMSAVSDQFYSTLIDVITEILQKKAEDDYKSIPEVEGL